MDRERGKRKARVGLIVSDKMDKTRVVAVYWSQRHPLYKRQIRRITRFMAHDAGNATRQGDLVRIIETRPLSKRKRWRIVEVLARAEVVELNPEELAEALTPEVQEQPPAPQSKAEAPEPAPAAVVETPTVPEEALEAPPESATMPQETVEEQPQKAPRVRARRKAGLRKKPQASIPEGEAKEKGAAEPPQEQEQGQ